MLNVKNLLLTSALGLMFASAYFACLGISAIRQAGTLVGLLEYTHQLQKLRWYASGWLGLATTLPFLAALLLGREKRTGSYAIRVVESAIGFAIFAIMLAVVNFLRNGRQ